MMWRQYFREPVHQDTNNESFMWIYMVKAVKNALADLKSVRGSEGLALQTSANSLYGVQHIHINLSLIQSVFIKCPALLLSSQS